MIFLHGCVPCSKLSDPLYCHLASWSFIPSSKMERYQISRLLSEDNSNLLKMDAEPGIGLVFIDLIGSSTDVPLFGFIYLSLDVAFGFLRDCF